MIFRHVGPFVSHHWKSVLACWGLAILVCTWTAPDWRNVVRDGEFSFLPKSAPSQVAEAVYQKSFSRDLLGSTAVIVVRRAGRAAGLLPQDRAFIEDVLKPAIKRIAKKDQGPESSIVRAVRTADDRLIGQLLTSADGKTTLVLVELTTGFLDSGNWRTLSEIETLIAQEGELVGRPDNLFAKKLIPPGLDLSLSGPAAVGRDLRRNADVSTHAIVQWSLLVVVAGLLLFYRAPLLALVPLVTVLAAVGLTMAVLTHLADLGWLGVFAGQENYLIVVLVGLGLVSSLLFIARENETRFQTPTLEDAAAESLRLAGPTLAGGMMLAILGLGMLIFAQFGKFQELGGAFLIGAGFVLLAATTLAPPLVVLMGRWAFWPNMRTERISAESAWCLPRGAWSLVTERGWSGQIGQSLGRSLAERPRTVGLTCLFAMLPFVVVAGLCHSRLTYGMLSQLPEDKPSVKGAEIIQQQFPAGTTGPVTLLLEHPKWQFGTADGKAMVAKLSDRLEDRKGEFDIADIRSVAYPLGLTEKDVGSKTFLQRTLRHRKAVEYYVGDKAPAADHATKLEIVFAQDPFARESIDNFERLRSKLPELLPSELAGAKWHLMGAPASIRDLKTVTDRDRALVYGLVLAGVFAGLLFLVRRVAVAAGLTITGGLCFLTALGATYAATWAWNPAEFDGLDWKVPTLLFVILMAFGVQGAWVLLARLDEEQQQHGHREGLLRALECTGSLCLGGGFLVAGVFASMMSGSLVGLEQLGFALASGILLDALIIRPLLIPAGLLVVSQNFTQSELPSPLKSLPPKAPPPENLAATVPPKTGT